jgi:beta-phosphoglucomutase
VRSSDDLKAAFGVIFDMDGVLVDSADAHWRSWQVLGQRNGVQVREKHFSQTFGRQNRDIIPIFFGYVASSEALRLAEAKEEIYRDLIRERPPLVPGAGELIRNLHSTGARLAIGSSGPRANIELVVSALGVGSCFDALICAEDVTRGKPDPQVFLLSASRIGLPPARCVVVEDAPSGVAAAKAAGAKCAAVMMHHDRAALADADHVVERLADLKPEQLRALALR